MYGYIYKTTNNINNKIYIGQHKSTLFKTTYKGSGSLIRRAFETYGKENFTVTLLEWCEDSSLADQRERYWIEYFKSTDPNIGYNLSKGGKINTFAGLKHSKDSKIKMSESHLGKKLKEETKERISKSKTGIKYSKESCLKISKSLHEKYQKEGRVSPHKGSKMSEESKLLISNWHKGRKLSEETRLKMSASHIGTKHKPHKKHNYPKNRKNKNS